MLRDRFCSEKTYCKAPSCVLISESAYCIHICGRTKLVAGRVVELGFFIKMSPKIVFYQDVSQNRFCVNDDLVEYALMVSLLTLQLHSRSAKDVP